MFSIKLLDHKLSARNLESQEGEIIADLVVLNKFR